MNKLFLTGLFFLFSSLTTLNINAHQIEEPGHCCKVYASFYTKNDVLVQREHAIPFEHETGNVDSTGGIEHVPGSTDILLRWPGVYRITYSVSLKSGGGRVALSLDGEVVPGSQMFVGESNHLSTLSVLVKMCHSCGKTLRVINNHSDGWFNDDIKLKAGHDNENVTASILIEKISTCHCCDGNEIRDLCGNDPCCKQICQEHPCQHPCQPTCPQPCFENFSNR